MPRFWWFQGDSVEQLTEQLIAAGVDARLEVYLQGDHMTLRVAAGADKVSVEAGTINESHPCPPLCP